MSTSHQNCISTYQIPLNHALFCVYVYELIYILFWSHLLVLFSHTCPAFFYPHLFRDTQMGSNGNCGDHGLGQLDRFRHLCTTQYYSINIYIAPSYPSAEFGDELDRVFGNVRWPILIPLHPPRWYVIRSVARWISSITLACPNWDHPSHDHEHLF